MNIQCIYYYVYGIKIIIIKVINRYPELFLKLEQLECT